MALSRRGFLSGLLALPLAKLAPQIAAPEAAHFVGVDWASGSDQTSILLVSWGEGPAAGAVRDVREITYLERRVQTNWLKRELNR